MLARVRGRSIREISLLLVRGDNAARVHFRFCEGGTPKSPFGSKNPRGTPQNRPVGDTSKPASEAHPGQLDFYLTRGPLRNSFRFQFADPCRRSGLTFGALSFFFS